MSDKLTKRDFLRAAFGAATASGATLLLQPFFPIPEDQPTEFDKTGAKAPDGAKWAIRFGAEPIDLHIADKTLGLSKKFVEKSMGVTAGPGGVFNHNYIEIGTIDSNGNFESRKRIHGIGIDKDGNMTGDGRLVGFVVDGARTKFENDPLQKDDPHAVHRNQLQHASVKNQIGGDYTKIVLTGSEEQIMRLYADMVKGTIDMNNRGRQSMSFGLLGQEAPNSNSFNGAMKQILAKSAQSMGLKIENHDAWGIDIGSTYDMKPDVSPTEKMDLPTLRAHVDELERTASEQLKGIQGNLESNTKVPVPAALRR